MSLLIFLTHLFKHKIPVYALNDFAVGGGFPIEETSKRAERATMMSQRPQAQINSSQARHA